MDVVGVERERLIFRVYVHESADVEAAQRFWLELTEAQPGQFRRPTLKRHNPRTVRKNIGADYHGCLKVNVRRGTDLYRKIEGWATAVMAAHDGSDDQPGIPAALGARQTWPPDLAGQEPFWGTSFGPPARYP